MKYCKNCSAVLGDLDVFCSECGASVDLDDNTQNGQNLDPNGTYNGYVPNQNQDQNQNYNNYNQQQQQQNYGGGQYNNYNQPPQGKSPGQTWLICSIISLLCCGGLFAIPSLVFAIQSNQSFNRGDIAEAESKANTAKILFFVAIGVAIVVYILGFITGILDFTGSAYTY